jgi:predicted helicase
MWRKGEKLEFVAKGQIPWQELTPDVKNTWLVAKHADEYREFPSMEEMFDLHTNGRKTNRDDVVYDWDRNKLTGRIRKFITDYNAEAYRHRADPNADWPDHIKWSETLKKAALRGETLKLDLTKIVRALYRPYTQRWLYFDSHLNERVY